MDRIAAAMGAVLLGKLKAAYCKIRDADLLPKGGFLGRIFDAFGPHVILIPGSILLVFATMVTSICTQYYQFLLAQGLLTGLSYGMLYVLEHARVTTS